MAEVDSVVLVAVVSAAVAQAEVGKNFKFINFIKVLQINMPHFLCP